jgi:hypothetical protein
MEELSIADVKAFVDVPAWAEELFVVAEELEEHGYSYLILNIREGRVVSAALELSFVWIRGRVQEFVEMIGRYLQEGEWCSSEDLARFIKIPLSFYGQRFKRTHYGQWLFRRMNLYVDENGNKDVRPVLTDTVIYPYVIDPDIMNKI